MSLRWRVLCNNLIRQYSQSGSSGSNAPPATPAAPSSGNSIKVDVPGLSANIIAKSTEPVGPGVDPGKQGEYKVPEYFCYNPMSYFEAEIEMSKFRLPQPVAPRK